MTAAPDIEEAPKPQKDLTPYIEGLEGWFRRQWPDAQDLRVHDLSIPMATGFSNETVFFEVAWRADGVEHDERFVARIEPPDGGIFPLQNEACAVSVEVQQRIMHAVEATGAAPMPPMLPYEPDRSVLGQPFFVMGFVPGVIPADSPRYTQAGFLVDEATPAERTRMLESGLEAMAGLHRIDWREAGLQWLAPEGGDAPSQRQQIEIYRRYVDAELRGRPHPAVHQALDWLEANDPQDERVGLSWGDSRLGNIIWQDYRCGAVVDWEACALCPTEADVGWWLMFDRMSHEDLDTERLPGFPTRPQMIAHYEKVSGREVRDPHYWEVFGTLRFCAIFIRLGDRMMGHGLVPPDSTMFAENMVSDSLLRLLANGPKP